MTRTGNPTRDLVVTGLLWLGAVGLALVLVLPAAALWGDDVQPLAGDLKAMQGNWILNSNEVEAKWSLEGDTLRVTLDDMVYVCKVSLDSTASPRTIDFFVQQGPGDVVGKTSLGIYKIDEGQVTLCVRRPGESGRPTEFKDIEDETFLIVIRKAP
jgi:uncharacterized protein (TIGR03067 family)